MNEVVGEIRKGQLITMFGVGSMIDLPHLSVLVNGLHRWSQSPDMTEPRLLSAVRSKLPGVMKVCLPPVKNSDEPERMKIDPNGVPVSLFPQWLRCSACSMMAHIKSGVFEPVFPPFQIDKIKYVHKHCVYHKKKGGPPTAIPVRFLVACKRGHIDDFPWFEFCHRGGQCKKDKSDKTNLGQVNNAGLSLIDSGVTGEVSEVLVRCNTCGSTRPLAYAFGMNADLCIPGCSGKHLHISDEKEECKEKPEAILLGASNLYFPLTVSVLALPEQYVLTDLHATINQHWDRMEKVTSLENAQSIIEFGGIKELNGVTAKELFKAVNEIRAGEPTQKLAELREEEYALLSNLSEPINSQRFAAEKTSELSPLLKNYFDSIALVTRLTELCALVGFTRLESAGDLFDFDSVDPERLAPLMPGTTNWVPGTKNKGEGVFFRLSEKRLREWEKSTGVKQRMHKLRKAFDAYRSERPWIKTEFPSARYVLLHTLSHALARELAITCGYSTTSIKERIYSRAPEEGVEPMAGILIYTASSDSEGTLGGLVALGRPKAFEPILKSALERSRICSSDPICSYREIEKESKLHGAACHSCGFLAETSCERANQFLDRAFLVDTLGADGFAFFGDL